MAKVGPLWQLYISDKKMSPSLLSLLPVLDSTFSMTIRTRSLRTVVRPLLSLPLPYPTLCSKHSES